LSFADKTNFYAIIFGVFEDKIFVLLVEIFSISMTIALLFYTPFQGGVVLEMLQLWQFLLFANIFLCKILRG
jgi:hypothetical protein